MVTAVALAVGLSGVLAGCSHGLPRKPPAQSRTPSSSDTPRASPSVTHPTRPGKPVLAVKIDNVPAARPQTGLSKADIVYVEPVEGGLSRILAVFSSHLPKVVGPVRSARESDLDLLRQFGRPAFAYSGAQSKLLPLIHRAPVHDMSAGRVPGPYFRGGSRSAPHNLYAHPRKLLARAPHASALGDIGFRRGAPPPGGKAETSRTVRYHAFSVTFRWSRKQERWLVSMDGSPAKTTDAGRIGARTIVVQYTTIRPSRFHDFLGNVSPYTKTVGSGKALVLRGGKAYQARWSRPKAKGGTRFTTWSGKPMTFARGQVWVVFAPRR